MTGADLISTSPGASVDGTDRLIDHMRRLDLSSTPAVGPTPAAPSRDCGDLVSVAGPPNGGYPRPLANADIGAAHPQRALPQSPGFAEASPLRVPAVLARSPKAVNVLSTSGDHAP